MDNQRKELEIIRNTIAAIVTYLHAKIQQEDKEIDETKMKRAPVYKVLKEHRASTNMVTATYPSNHSIHKATISKTVKELQAKKSRESDKLAALKKA